MFMTQACQDLNFRDWEASVSTEVESKKTTAWSSSRIWSSYPGAGLFDGQNPVGVQAIHGRLASGPSPGVEAIRLCTSGYLSGLII